MEVGGHDEEVTSSKKNEFKTRVQKILTLFMTKIDTLFMTKIAENP